MQNLADEMHKNVYPWKNPRTNWTARGAVKTINHGLAKNVFTRFLRIQEELQKGFQLYTAEPSAERNSKYTFIMKTMAVLLKALDSAFFSTRLEQQIVIRSLCDFQKFHFKAL